MDNTVWKQVRHGLIVSCQADAHNPMSDPHIIAALAYNAQLGGAKGIRLSGADHLKAVKQMVHLPVFDCHKKRYEGYEVYITPTCAEAKASADSGADVIVIDATPRPRPGNLSVTELITYIHNELDKPVLADVSTFEEGLQAASAGADAVSTTMAGYTSYSRRTPDADLDLLKALCKELTVPVIAEGRIRTPAMAKEALNLGAWAVVVGTAITVPWLITKDFVAAMTQNESSKSSDARHEA